MCHAIASITKYRLFLALLGPVWDQTASAVPDGLLTEPVSLELSLARQAAAKTEPISECKQADNAHGTAVRGSLKCTAARTAPSALFCIPTCSNIQHMWVALYITANSIATCNTPSPVAYCIDKAHATALEGCSLLQGSSSGTHDLETPSNGMSQCKDAHMLNTSTHKAAHKPQVHLQVCAQLQ